MQLHLQERISLFIFAVRLLANDREENKMQLFGKKYIVSVMLAACCLSPLCAAGRLYVEEPEESVSVQLYFGATFRKRLPYGISVYASEEIRSVLYDYVLTEQRPANPVACFSRSYTAVGIDYAPFDYLQVGAEYMLRLYGTKGWKSPRDYLRHRLSVSLTGVLPLEGWKLSLRERLVLDSRTDHPDPRTTAADYLKLRHRVRADWSPAGRKVAPYAFAELTQTLNEPSSPWRDETGRPFYRGQYLHRVRAEMGCKWTVNKRHALSFFYRLDTTWNRNLNIDGQNIVTLQWEKTYANCVGLFWFFDW